MQGDTGCLGICFFEGEVAEFAGRTGRRMRFLGNLVYIIILILIAKLVPFSTGIGYIELLYVTFLSLFPPGLVT